MTPSEFITAIRDVINDGALSKLVKYDNVSALKAAGRVSFPLSNRNIVDPSTNTDAVFMAQVDGADYVDATLTDAATGIGTVATAPTKSCGFMYYFQFFSDAQIGTFRDNGIRQVGVDPANSTAVSAIPTTLCTAVIYLAAAEALRVNAQAYVKFYDFNVAGKSLSKGKMFDNITKQAQTFEDQARELRTKYYTRQDRNLQGVFSVGAGTYSGDSFKPTR